MYTYDINNKILYKRGVKILKSAIYSKTIKYIISPILKNNCHYKTIAKNQPQNQ